MVSVDLGVVEVEFGLFPVAEGAEGLTLILFVAWSLLAVLGLRFAYYAHRNMARTAVDVQATLWVLLRYAGGLAALFGLAGVLEIVTSLSFEGKNGLLLAMALLLALALRQIHRTGTGEAAVLPGSFDRGVRVAFGVTILLYIALVAVTGRTAATATLEGVSAVGFILYGGAYFQAQTANSRLQGTMLDSLLRHLLPVLTFAALVGIVALAVPLGVPLIVVLHVQVVFVIMTATALMTATIKLRQNLATL